MAFAFVLALRAVFLSREAIRYLPLNSFHDKSPCKALNQKSQNMNCGTFFLKIFWPFQNTSVAFYTSSEPKYIHLLAIFHLFFDCLPLGLHFHVCFFTCSCFSRIKFLLKMGQEVGAGGREQLGQSEHRKNKKDQISNTLRKHQCGAVWKEYGCAIKQS